MAGGLARQTNIVYLHLVMRLLGATWTRVGGNPVGFVRRQYATVVPEESGTFFNCGVITLHYPAFRRRPLDEKSVEMVEHEREERAGAATRRDSRPDTDCAAIGERLGFAGLRRWKEHRRLHAYREVRGDHAHDHHRSI